MTDRSRRGLLWGLAGVAVAGGAARVWWLHQSVPPRDPAAEERFRQSQAALLAQDGGRIQSRFVEIAEPRMRVQVLEGGTGEPVVFLHGGNGVAAQWEPLLSRMSDGFHVYAPDRPGCGLSTMFDYRGVPFREHAVAFVGSVMDALGLKKAALVGNSMGGYFALVFALAHPERVTKLVTIGEPAGSSDTVPRMNQMMATRGINGMMYATILRPGPKSTMEGFRRMLVAHPERLSQTYLDCNTAAAEIPGATESWLTMLEDVKRPGGRFELTYALRPELHQLTMPTLLMWGEKDAFGPPARGQEMAAMMPQGSVVVLRDAGHLAWLDQPAVVEQQLRGFLQT